jgi:GNAT superfamily N-acetyltransferase
VSTAAVHVRAAQPGEHQLLSDLAHRAKAHWGYDAAQLAVWHMDMTVSSESLQQRPTFVAEVEGAVVGFFQLSMNAARAELEHFWVLPSSHRRGIGRALLTHAAAVVAAAGHRTLHIDADPNAEPFYTACGAQRVGALLAPISGQPQRVRPRLELSVGSR